APGLECARHFSGALRISAMHNGHCAVCHQYLRDSEADAFGGTGYQCARPLQWSRPIPRIVLSFMYGRIEDLGNGFAADWVPRIRSNFHKRDKNKRALEHPWMREDGVNISANQIAVKKQVEIKRSRRIGPVANTEKSLLSLQ